MKFCVYVPLDRPPYINRPLWYFGGEFFIFPKHLIYGREKLIIKAKDLLKIPSKI